MALFEDVITAEERSRSMGSVLSRVRKRKQRLGEVQVMVREEYAGLDVDAKVELIRGLIPLGLMHVHELLDDEVVALAGPRHARNDGVAGMRHGSNPGTVRLAGQRVAVRVPRVRGEQGEIPLRSYQALHGSGEVNDQLPLRLMHVHELLDDEVVALAGPRHARNDGVAGMRHGSNPGTVRLAGQRVAVRVPRVRGEQGEIPLRSYQALHGSGEVNDQLLLRVLYGISCRNYAVAAEAIPGALGLSSSSVSRAFVEASSEKLREFQERDLSNQTYVALFLDGKTFADATLVIAMGVTARGDKRFLGFVETDTENEKVLTPFLRSLVERGLDVAEGLLVVIDGGKGLRAAVNQVLRKRSVVQRCVWHKRENVVSYLPKSEQAQWRRRLQRAYDRPTYAEAKAALTTLYRELEHRNQSAAASLAEGMEET